jgi:phosphoserine phosphatase RsbU/P
MPIVAGGKSDSGPFTVDAPRAHNRQVNPQCEIPEGLAMALLTVVSGHDDGRVYPVSEPRCRLGRQDDCHVWDLFAPYPEISRHHAEIERTAEGFLLRDLNSRHGTRLNGEMIRRPVRLCHGDRIGICAIELMFCRTDAAPGTALGEAAADLTRFVDDSSGSSVQSRIDVVAARHGGGETAERPDGRLRALIAMLADLGESLELDHVLDDVLDAVLRIFPMAERGFVGLRQDGGEDILPSAVKCRRQDRKEQVRLCRSIVDEVVHEKRAILWDDPEDWDTPPSESLRAQQIRSVICAPLLDSEGGALGLLQVDTSEPSRGFHHDDLEILVALSHLVSVALQHARLHKLRLELQSIERDMVLAKGVVESLLPQGKPALGGYDLLPFYRPARHVGGDYYDYIPLADGRLAVVIADAAGKGIPAALLMMTLSGMLKALLAREPVAEAVGDVNRWLAGGDFAGRFVTMAVVVLDAASEEIVMVNAGHYEPLLRREDGTIEALGEKSKGLPLGVREEENYLESPARLRPGECVTLYTDGIIEAFNEAGEAFGYDRLLAALCGDSGSLGQLAERIIADVHRHVGQCEQSDDITLVCLGRPA